MSKPSNHLKVERVTDRTEGTQTTGQLKGGMYDPQCEASVARAERARGKAVDAEFGREART